jgi:hypothetical protein
MSQQYDNTNRWALFKNDNRRDEKSPEYSGTLNVDGVEYFLNGWVKEGKKGRFFSGSIKRKEGNPVAGLRDELRANSPQAPARGRAPIDDDIPFSMEWR